MSEITIRDALAMVEAGLRAGLEAGAAISIAVIDGGGHLLAFARMDDAVLASVEVSQVKARTALFFLEPKPGIFHSINPSHLPCWEQ